MIGVVVAVVSVGFVVVGVDLIGVGIGVAIGV